MASARGSATTHPPAARVLNTLAVLPLLALTDAHAAGTVDYFADNGFGNPLSTLQHPCAEHYNGVTYIAYQGPHEDPYVCAYHHGSGKWTGPVQAGANPMGKIPDPTDADAVDNHGRPALIVDTKGHIHLVFGGHGGHYKLGRNRLGTSGKGKQTHVMSKRPEDIYSWQVLDNISPFGTYSQFVKMDDGDLYLFYRHGSHRSDWVYQKSTDDGRTFTPPVSVLKHKARAEDRNIHDAWYAWFGRGKGDTITASYIYHPCRIRGHTAERYNGYFMRMDCTDESWENVSGEALVLPVTKEVADRRTRVCDTGKMRSKRGTCRVDAKGHPHLYFRQGKGRIRYYRWLGDRWQEPVTVAPRARGHDGDLLVESPHVIRMVLTRSLDGRGEVGWWKTTDGGLTWKMDRRLISAPAAHFDIGALVRNAHPDARVVAAESKRRQGHLYRRMYLLGDSGPVPRPKREASCLEGGSRNQGPHAAPSEARQFPGKD